MKRIERGQKDSPKAANTNETYRDRLIPLAKISSLEQFFDFKVFLKGISHLPKEMDLFLFKEGEVPMWEESPEGGIWITKLKFHENVDLMWESLMFSIIGE